MPLSIFFLLSLSSCDYSRFGEIVPCSCASRFFTHTASSSRTSFIVTVEPFRFQLGTKMDAFPTSSLSQRGGPRWEAHRQGTSNVTGPQQPLNEVLPVYMSLLHTINILESDPGRSVITDMRHFLSPVLVQACEREHVLPSARSEDEAQEAHLAQRQRYIV